MSGPTGRAVGYGASCAHRDPQPGGGAIPPSESPSKESRGDRGAVCSARADPAESSSPAGVSGQAGPPQRTQSQAEASGPQEPKQQLNVTHGTGVLPVGRDPQDAQDTHLQAGQIQQKGKRAVLLFFLH